MKKKFKLKYRILILAAVFFGALYFFSRNYLIVRSFDLTRDTMEMEEASLPSISLMVGEEELNRLYGYTSNLDWTLIRETITPLEGDQTFTVRIDENRMTVRRLKYELYDVSSSGLLEEGTISALTSEENGSCKTARIKLKTELAEGTEYSVKVTLITSTSKRIYYYTRIKMYQNGALTAKLNYVRWFRESVMNKKNELLIEKNLETKSNADTTSFARVTIESDWETVSWGDLAPVIVAELPPTVTDFYEGTAAVVLSYIVSVNGDIGTEYYLVRECFRFLYTDIRTYLYNYERETEAIYDVLNTNLSKDDLKLGITNDTGMELLTADSYKYTAFVRNRELWCYDRTLNQMNCIFSFRSSEDFDLMELYDAHAVKILNLDSRGNIDFLVYGYMNRGEYEGRVGIVLYRYYHEENRIEEEAYIPVNTTYQLLKGELNECIYMNRFDVLYLAVYDTVYSYNLTTRILSVVADQVPQEHVVFLPGLQLVIWQETPEDAESKELTVLNLENGEKSKIAAPKEEVICLLGAVETSLIYGYAKESDIAVNYDGTLTIPLYRVLIADPDGTVRKNYEKDGVYVTAAAVEENVITLERVKKRDSTTLAYDALASDVIQNHTVAEVTSVSIVSRVTKLMRTEYYISFPGDVSIEKLPSVISPLYTVLSTDTTVRITASEELAEEYLTYSFGRVVVRTKNAAYAIRLADEDESVGSVIDSEGKVVWERGIKSAKSSISGITPVGSGTMNGLQAALRMIFTYKGLEVDTTAFSFTEKPITEWLEQYMNVSAVNLKGISLDEALYYVYRKRPVIAVTGPNSALLLCGYDASNIEVVDTSSGKTRKISRDDAGALFEECGNLFFSYID